MADIESNIDINIDTSNALAGLRALQREISTFHQTMAKSGAVSNAKLADMQQNLINGINSSGQFSASMQTVRTTTESFTNALEKNKLSMGQYFRYAGSQVTGFRKLFSTEFDTIDKVARERVKTLQTQYIKLGRDANGAMKAIAVRPNVLDMKDLGTQTAIAAQKTLLFNQLMKQGSTELLNFGKNTQWAGRQLMVGFTIPLGIMGAAAAREFMKMEEQVIRLQRVYGDFSTSASETDAMADSVKNLGVEFTKYGVAVEKTIGLAADAAAMGKTGVDLLAQVTEATRLAVLGGVEQSQALETTISLQNAFGVSSEKLAGKINFLNAVENQTATSIEDLTEAIPKAGPVVQQLGGSVEDLAFFMTAMKEGGIDAAEGANALKSGLASLINPTGEANDMLAGFGINLTDIVNRNSGNVSGLITEFARSLDTLDPLNRAQAIEALFGKFQFARMSTLFQNVIAEGSQASRVLELTKNSATELALLSERELARVEASPMYKFQAAVESFKASLAPVGEEFLKAVTPLINFGTDVLNKFNEMGEGSKQFVITVVGIVAAIGPVLLMTFGLLANGVANLIKGFMFVKSIFDGTGKSSNILSEQINYMTTEQMEAAAVASSLGQVHTSLIQTFNAEAGAVRNLANAYGSAIAVQAGFMGPITPSGGRKPKKMASGGQVPGSGNGDTVPAMLTPGEFVLTKDVAAKYPGLIAAMMSGTIQGFSGGGAVGGNMPPRVGMHAAGKMDMSLQANIDEANRLFPGMIATLQRFPELQEAIVFLTDLTADKAQELNNSARKGGLDADEFDRQWNETGNTGFVATAQRGSVAMGEGDLSDAEIEELVGIDKNIGKRVTDRIRQTTAEQRLQDGWLDDIIAEETGKIIDEGLQSTDPVKKSVAKKLDNRRKTMVETRSVGWSKLTDPRTGEKFKKSSDAIEYYESQGALTQTSSGKQMTLAGSSTSVARKTSSGSWRSDSTAATVGMIAGGSYATSAARNQRNSQDFKDFADEQDRKWAEAASDSAETASPSKRTKKVAKDTVDGFVLGLQDGQDDVAKAGKKAGQAATPNTNPAFGRVAGGVTPPAVISPGAIKNLTDKFPKIVGQVPNLRDAQMGAYGGTNILKGKELQFARGAKLLDSAQMLKPMVVLNAAMKTAANGVKTASIAVKDFGIKTASTVKTFSINTVNSMKQLAISAKQTAVSIGQSAKQMAINAANAVKGAYGGGKFAAIGMGASTALMMASGVEGPMGDLARSVSGPLMAFSALSPILGALPPQVQVAVYGFAAVGAAAMAAKGAFDEGVKKSIEFNNQIGASTKAIEGLAAFSGTVSASQIKDKERSDALYSASQQGVKDPTIGQQYLESEAGKVMADTITTQMKSVDMSMIRENIYQQMATGIATGAVTPETAKSIVMALGEKLQDPSMAISVNARIDELFGPDGERLADSLPEITVALSKESLENTKSSLETLNSNLNTTPWQAAGNDWLDYVTLGVHGLTDYWGQYGEITGLMISSGTIAAQQQQALLDALDVEYEKRLAIANASGDKQAVDTATEEYQAQREQLIKNQNEARAAATSEYKREAEKMANSQKGTWARTEAENAMGAQGQAMDEQIKQRYANDPALAQQAQRAQDLIVASEGNSQEAQVREQEVKFLLSTGDIPPQTFIDLLDGLDEAKAGKVNEMSLKIVSNLGTAEGGQVLQMANLISNDDLQADFMGNFAESSTEEAKELYNFYSQVLENGGEQALNIVLNSEATGDDLKEAYSEIDELFASGEQVTYSQLLEQITSIDAAGIAGMEANQEWFNSLPAAQQKAYITRYLTVYETVTGDQAMRYLKENKVAKSGNYAGSVQQYSEEQLSWAAGQIANQSGQQLISEMNAAPPTPPPGPGSSGGGGGGGSSQPEKAPTSFLDSIVKSLRDVRVGAQKMTENFADSWAAINGMFGGGRGMNVFGGLQQQMRALGAGEDLITLIAGMSPEEFEQRKNDLFTFDAAGNITGLKDMLNSIGAAMRAIALGEFQNKQQAALKAANDQNTAIRKLVAAGYSYADAFKIAEDAAVAHAIANENDANTINQVAVAATAATRAISSMSAAQSVANANQGVADREDTLDFLETYAGNLTNAQQAAILANEQLSYMAANFDTLTPEQLAIFQDALENADLAAEVDIRVNMQTIEGMEKIFSDGFSKAMESFAAQEKAIGIKFELLEDPFKTAMQAFEDKIEDLRNAPGGLDDLEADLQRISDQETDINKKYKDRTDSLDKVEKANQRIQQQQQAQLTVADALSRGDIAAAARAAAELNAQEAQQAAQDQREALQKSQELEISRLTGTMGMTREQIEARVRDIKTQILELEERGIEPARRQVELLERQRQVETESLTVLGLTKDKWTEIENNINLAKTAGESYQTAMEGALGVVEEITNYWSNLDGREVSTIHTIIERKIEEKKAAVPAPTPAAAPAPAPVADYHTEAYRNDMARRVIRGEFGNGGDRINNLGADYQWIQDRVNDMVYHRNGYAKGGMVASYLARGGFPRMPKMGTDTVPAMLTPGEFVMTKYAVKAFGASNLKDINNGTYKDGSVYNNSYSINVNVKSDSNANEIARTVIAQIKQIDSQRIRGNRF